MVGFGVSNEMPDIYLHIDGQQTGPYQLDQVRQMLAEGKVSAQTMAWYQGLNEWVMLAKVLATFRPEGTPPAFAPPPPPPPPPSQPVPAKKGMNGCLLAALIVGAVAFVGLFVVSCLAGIALGPITKGIEKAKENMAMQRTRQIGIAMVTYANDHNGAYPGGNTSTEVFQKLLDGKYITDPSVFYLAMTGKTKPASDKLTAENVCFDVTSGVTSDSSGDLPVVFSTGYTVTYSPGAGATRDPGVQLPFPGIVVAFKSNRAQWMGSPNYRVGPDGSIDQFIPATFDPGAKIYQQLKP